MIKITNLEKFQDGRTVLTINHLEVSDREIAVIIGQAGSGKTVLLSLLTGKTRPTAGTLRLCNLDPAQDHTGFSTIAGVMFGVDALYKRQTVLENLQFYCRLRGLPMSRAVDVLNLVGLADQSKTRVEKLSTGLARRLSFGLAILHNPDILILESPFERCDEASILQLSTLILALSENGKSILILTDSDTHLSGIADSYYLLEQGRIRQLVKPENEVESGSQQPFKIPVRMEGSVMLVNPADLYFAEVKEGRTYLYTKEDKLPSQYTLTELEDRLISRGFFRAHRSYLVNLQHVREVIPFTRDSYSLRINDGEGTLIPLSKTAASELKNQLGF